jgi:hypothetical protein
MADYRELLRRAIEALPENTGANRRAVYEKARGALVAQLRAIEPPLPAREITQHRLNLEDCIRQVEQEATDILLGRLRQPEPEPEPEIEDIAPEPEPEEPAEPDPVYTPEETEFAPAPEPEPEPEPERIEPEFDAPEPEPEVIEPDDLPEDEAPLVVDPQDSPLPEDAPFPIEETRDAMDEDVEGDQWQPLEEPEPLVDDGAVESEPYFAESELDNSDPDDRFDTPIVEDEPVAPDHDRDAEYAPVYDPEPVVEPEAPEPEYEPVVDEPVVDEPLRDTAPFEPIVIVPEDEPVEPVPSSDKGGPASIEEIIALAQANEANIDTSAPEAEVVEAEPVAPEPEPKPTNIIGLPLRGAAAMGTGAGIGLIRPGAATGAPAAPLVDIHGQPLHRNDAAAASPASVDATIGEAMSAVREVELEQPREPEHADPQSSIDRAIAALDREARGEGEPGSDEDEAAAAATTPEAGVREGLMARESELVDDQGEDEAERSGDGFGAFTIFLLITVVLLAGGGAAGYWAWREGYIDLNTVFAQADPEPAQTQDVATAEPETPAEPAAPTNTTGEGGVNGSAMPGEELPFVEPDPTPPATDQLPADDRLPAEEPGAPVDPEAPAEAETDVAIAATGTQSLLLEEQANGAAGAVPYSGNVDWSRGTDELGHPTIIASASIPARNLDVNVLIRRNADVNLPASHLMEVNFTVAESFVGGSIAGLPGVLLKDEELVQGQPLTGASARIVGNSFLFALSRASERDVEVNEQLLRDRDWLDLAMVYGTGRRAIMTLEKGEDGQQIFDDVMDAWAALDAEAPPADGPDAQ